MLNKVTLTQLHLLKQYIITLLQDFQNSVLKTKSEIRIKYLKSPTEYFETPNFLKFFKKNSVFKPVSVQNMRLLRYSKRW
jgi:hypothetical protein